MNKKRLTWDNVGERLYETGVKNTVLYPVQANGAYSKGIAWSGVTAFNESPSGADATKLYADDINYITLRAAEEYGFTIEAYTYPDEWAECDGSAEPTPGLSVGQQTRKMFGLCTKTTLGNDVASNDYGYKLHLVYGGQCSPSSRDYSTINDSPEAITFSWECTTNPVAVSGFKPTSSITIDSTKVDATKLKALEDILYGKDPSSEEANDGQDARLPLPDEVITLLTPAAG